MYKDLYTIFEVAQLLGLHEKTVRAYVHDGRLQCTRLGKQYRIARADLDAFAGGALSEGRQVAVPVDTEVSSVVEVNGLNAVKAQRLCNLILAAVKGQQENRPLRVETLYDEVKVRLKIVILGSLEATGILLSMIDHLALAETSEK